MTNPLLDVLEVLLEAFDNDRQELHGWAIMKAAARSGPTVYGVLDRWKTPTGSPAAGKITTRSQTNHGDVSTNLLPPAPSQLFVW